MTDTSVPDDPPEDDAGTADAAEDTTEDAGTPDADQEDQP